MNKSQPLSLINWGYKEGVSQNEYPFIMNKLAGQEKRNGIPEEIKADQNHLALSSTATAFLRTLIYFDIFSYPLTRDEILNYSAIDVVSEKEGLETLQHLLELGVVSEKDGYYLIGNNFNKISNRLEGNLLAARRIRKARLYSAIIASFPFTRGIFISGSLSKGYMDRNSDIDYFILTSPGRLWLSRTLLILFKKIFLLNSHRNFCINYFLDTENLEIRQRNIYTATEVALLLPMHNHELFDRFIAANGWVKKYYPHFNAAKGKPVKGLPGLKKILELILDNRFGDFLESLSYRTTTRYWLKKHGKDEVDSPDSDLMWSKSISQYNPRHFRPAVLHRFNSKLAEFEHETGIHLAET